MNWLTWMLHGDIGVDMFFVLSGFLIAYILMKEHKKYGEIDLASFYRGRFLRIWPAMFVANLIDLILKSIKTERMKEFTMRAMAFDIGSQIPDADRFNHAWSEFVELNTFTGNIGGVPSHLWSVCVEF